MAPLGHCLAAAGRTFGSAVAALWRALDAAVLSPCANLFWANVLEPLGATCVAAGQVFGAFAACFAARVGSLIRALGSALGAVFELIGALALQLATTVGAVVTTIFQILSGESQSPSASS